MVPQYQITYMIVPMIVPMIAEMCNREYSKVSRLKHTLIPFVNLKYPQYA